MKKILVIFTGGTFASENSSSGLRPKFSDQQLLEIFPKVKNLAIITTTQIFNLDSTNINPIHWEKISTKIFENYNEFDGFVVIHGTDTMHFSAAATSFALQNLQKPVVFTGSVLPPKNIHSDAEQNLLDSLLVAKSDSIKEVCICFGGKILKATHVRKFTNEATRFFPEKIGVFAPINSYPIGTVNSGNIIYNKSYFASNNYPNKKLDLQLYAKFSSDKVASLKIFPGLSGSILQKFYDFKIMILEAFAVGNIPFKNSNWIEEIGKFTQKNLLFISTQNPFGEVDLKLYEVGKKAKNSGAISLKNMITETAIVKAAWILGNWPNFSKTEIKNKMLQNFCGEIQA